MFQRFLQFPLFVGLLCGVLFLVQPVTQAQAEENMPTLFPGEKAPALSIGSWIKGEPVTEFKKDHVYVVEFWATWCGPCIKNIPHLSELQKKYADKNLTIIGVSIDSDGEKVVKEFVTEMDKKMEYTVALDKIEKDSGLTSEAWMSASMQNGIPTAYIVNQAGQIAWIGYPAELEVALEPVLTGKWDVTVAKNTFLNAIRREQQLKSIVKLLESAVTKKNIPQIIALTDQLVAVEPEFFGEDDYDVNLFKFEQVLKAGGIEEGYKIGDEVIAEAADDKNGMIALVLMANTVVELPEGKARDLDWALKCVTKANEMTEGKDFRVLYTMSEVTRTRGDVAKANEYLSSSIELCPVPTVKKKLESIYEAYNQPKKEETPVEK
jgi:thiol-disulfide isomerase/thioredoxin